MLNPTQRNQYRDRATEMAAISFALTFLSNVDTSGFQGVSNWKVFVGIVLPGFFLLRQTAARLGYEFSETYPAQTFGLLTGAMGGYLVSKIGEVAESYFSSTK